MVGSELSAERLCNRTGMGIGRCLLPRGHDSKGRLRAQRRAIGDRKAEAGWKRRLDSGGDREAACAVRYRRLAGYYAWLSVRLCRGRRGHPATLRFPALAPGGALAIGYWATPNCPG